MRKKELEQKIDEYKKGLLTWIKWAESYLLDSNLHWTITSEELRIYINALMRDMNNELRDWESWAKKILESKNMLPRNYTSEELRRLITKKEM